MKRYRRVIPLRVTDEQHTLLEELAAERGIGLSPLIRLLLFAVDRDAVDQAPVLTHPPPRA